MNNKAGFILPLLALFVVPVLELSSARPVVAGEAAGLTLDEYARDPLGHGQVLFLRHALAPGFDANGEPEKFRLDDCSTQRNLNAAGREQAKTIGEKVAEKGIRFARILSSQWCRCLETAELLGLGEVMAEPALNSGFNGIFDPEATLEALRSILDTLDGEQAPVLMVTHYGNISAITGIFVESGEAVAYDTRNHVSRTVSLD